MTNLTSTRSSHRAGSVVAPGRATVRWLVTFVGFPLGGLVAMGFPGSVDTPAAALVGGLITGAILGAIQAWGLGPNRPPADLWIVATAIGLMVGLGIGATVVDFGTSLGALALQGAISGLSVGIAQGAVLWSRLGRLSLAWPPTLAAIWALGWVITTSAGVQVDEQFTVFGAAGAVVVTALTVVLPLVLNRTTNAHYEGAHAS